LENLLEDTEASVASVARKTGDGFDVSSELKRDNAALDIKGDLYKSSELRA
jgi:hypothetical protein